MRGLSKGMVLALFGVSNGAIQFMTYEELKRWRIDQRVAEGAGEEGKNLVSLSSRYSTILCSYARTRQDVR